MNISHKLITLGLAFSLLGSTCAFARPMQHFENRGPSFDKKTIASHVLTEKKHDAAGYAPRPSAAVQDDWPANMILD